MRKKNCRKETGSESLSESIGRCFDLPQDALSGYAHIELFGNSEAIVEGCKGVLEYTDGTVALNTGKLTVRVCGCNLTITAMQDSSTVIRGIITAIDFTN
ncbi:MAG: YabP/YqfC family sporulation protein [Clostridia bacterium]|nr:YabP/YqfC family sporulation protein [Clostridia bacterium]